MLKSYIDPQQKLYSAGYDHYLANGDMDTLNAKFYGMDDSWFEFVLNGYQDAANNKGFNLPPEYDK